MKKIFLAAALLCSSLAGFALDIQQTKKSTTAPYKVRDAKHKVDLTPVSYNIISNTPAGEQLPDLTWSSDAAYPDGNGGVAWTQISGFAANVVVNGNKIYIYAPLTQLSEIATAWIEGTISADGKTATFRTPQAYMINGFDYLFATRLNADGTADPNNLNLVFSIDEDGNMIQTDNGILALTNLQAGFYGYADMNIVMEKITDQVVKLPEGVTLESYLLDFKKGDNANRQTALIGFDGDDVYFSDPLGIEDSWFKGVKSGNTITVSTPQYMGSGVGFPMYVTTGKELRTTKVDQMTGQTYEEIDYQVTPEADIVFTIDEATGVISTKQLLLMSSSKDSRGNAYSALMGPKYTPWEPVAAIPATPEIEFYIDLNDYAEYGLSGCMVSYIIPSLSTDGEFIPQENLYYQICFDDKPLEFYETTMIPYFGQFTDYSTMESIQLSTDNYDSHNLQVPYNPKKTLSIQSFYEFNGEMIASEKMDYDLIDGELVPSGIDAVAGEDEVQTVRYFNLNGVAVQPGEGSGIVIRETVFKDGKHKTEKVIF